MKPIIALTCDIDEESRIRLLQSYCDAIRIGGGTPIIIPPTTDKEEIEELLQQTNAKGVILTGGADIDPTFFNEERHPKIGRISRQRDEYEFAVLEVAEKCDIPILGICRGLQVINVAYGGTITQDMPSQLGEEYSLHDQQIPTTEAIHRVTFTPNSQIASLFEQYKVNTNSHHHQCIGKIGKNLMITGRTDDGIIEAIESKTAKTIAVQFHPERMPDLQYFFKNWLEKNCTQN